MKIPKGVWIFMVGMAAGGVICFYAYLFLGVLFSSVESSPPKIAGMTVPQKTYEIDFSKRYNIILRNSATYTYTNCLIKGCTHSGKESSSRGGYYFDTWLVVELSDGRMVYFSPHDITILEEFRP
jgi:hypothetical protein